MDHPAEKCVKNYLSQKSFFDIKNIFLTSTSQSLQRLFTCRNPSKTLAITTSILFCAILFPANVKGSRQVVTTRAEEDWLKSEKDVRTLEKIISNLYGRENPFNLLTKRSGIVAPQSNSGSKPNQHNSITKLEKRYVKHMNQLYKDSLDFNLLRPHEECPLTPNGDRQFVCPRQTLESVPVCISSKKLCNLEADCPGGDDEDEKLCLFHRPVMAQLHDLTQGIASFHQNTLKKVEQLILSEVPKALFFATDNHNEIATRISEHHSRTRERPAPPTLVEGVEMMDITSGDGELPVVEKHHLMPLVGPGRHPFFRWSHSGGEDVLDPNLESVHPDRTEGHSGGRRRRRTNIRDSRRNDDEERRRSLRH